MSNKFGLDDYTYNVLIDYFKSKPEIKVVRIYGSRARGNYRSASDIDMFIEGTYEPDYLQVIEKETENLRIPYRCDYTDVNESEPYEVNFVFIRISDSKVLYRRKDYFPNDDYKELACNKNSEIKQICRWMCRYENYFKINYPDLIRDVEKMIFFCENDIYDINFQIEVFVKFKSMFEGCWKVLKDYLKDEYKIYLYLPREIFSAAHEKGIIDNLQVWFDLIYDFNIMTDELFADIADEMIYRLKNKYLPEIEKLQKFFEPMYKPQYKTFEIHE